MTSILQSPPFFPLRMKKKAEEVKYHIFIIILKKLSVNISLIEAHEQILGYLKFMIYLVTSNRIVRFELIDNMHRCIAIASYFLAVEKEYPRAFTISSHKKRLTFPRLFSNQVWSL